MARYLLALSAGFFFACTILMGAYLALQFKQNAGSADSVSGEQPLAATGVPRSELIASEVENTPAQVENPFRFATATVAQEETAGSGALVTWANGTSLSVLFDLPLFVDSGEKVTLKLSRPATVRNVEGTEVNPEPELQWKLAAGGYNIDFAEGDIDRELSILTLDDQGKFTPPADEFAGVLLDPDGNGGVRNPEIDFNAELTRFRHDGPVLKLNLTKLPDGFRTTLSRKGDSWEKKVFEAIPVDLDHVGFYELKTSAKLRGYYEGVERADIPALRMTSFEVSTIGESATFRPEIRSVRFSFADVPNGTLKPAESTTYFVANTAATLDAASDNPSRKIAVVRDGVESTNTSTSGVPNDTTSVALERLPEGKSVSVKLRDIWAMEDSNAVTLIVPPQPSETPRPRITGYQSAQDVAPASVSSAAAVLPGRRVVFSGWRASTGTLELLLMKEAGGALTLLRSVSVNDTTGSAWTKELIIEETGPQFAVVAKYNNTVGHAYSNVFRFTAQDNLVSSVSLSSAALKNDELNDGIATDTSVVLEVDIVGTVAEDDRLIATIRGDVAGEAVIESAGTNPKVDMHLKGLQRGNNKVRLVLFRGFKSTTALDTEVVVQNAGPRVVDVQPNPLGFRKGQQSLTITFDKPLAPSTAKQVKNYFVAGTLGASSPLTIADAVYSTGSKQVTLKFSSLVVPDSYVVRVNGHSHKPNTKFNITATESDVGITDVYGNLLNGDGSGNGTDYQKTLGDGSEGASGENYLENTALRVGVPQTTGEQVDYPEFTKPRPIQNGFNPSDKVVTRVARLYYFRDAHRVTQLINRKAKSHNAQNASMSRQLADKARLFADQTTDRRRAAERQAVQSAKLAREAENRLEDAQRKLQDAESAVRRGNQRKRTLEAQIQDLGTQIRRLEESSTASDADSVPEELQRKTLQRKELQLDLENVNDAIVAAEKTRSLSTERASATAAAIEALRERELQDREIMNSEGAKEDRAIEQQFRLEVQAAKADPDTYAEGNPESIDPVAQVTLSVIGEGLIQMRGPRKGVNIVHTMINQIDAPVGQVRIGIHTVQVNGEKGERMERIVGRIGRYVDHSRFLTAQSMQMLRHAIALVASRRAQECGFVCDGIMPVSADTTTESFVLGGTVSSDPTTRYQNAFFGREFMDELRAMDSEFLHEGNKLLSLHSMDTTSLASALFILALANNDTRLEILETFRQMMSCDLPMKEMEYYTASLSGPTKKKPFFALGSCDCNDDQFSMLGQNARFVSFSGYFNGNIEGTHTLNPAQREFVKLAQILKSRLITEVELKQRVLERSVIEERLGDHKEQLRVAHVREERAQKELQEYNKTFRRELTKVFTDSQKISAEYASRITAVTEESDAQVKKSISIPSLVTGGTGHSHANAIASTIMEETRNRAVESLKNNDVQGFARRVNSGVARLYASQGSEPPKNEKIGILSNGKRLEIEPDWTVKGKNQTVFVEGIRERASQVMESKTTALLSPVQKDQIAYTLKEAIRLAESGSVPQTLVALFKAIGDSQRLAGEKLEGERQAILAAFENVGRNLKKAAQASIEGNTELASSSLETAHQQWVSIRPVLKESGGFKQEVEELTQAFGSLLSADLNFTFAAAAAQDARRPLDHKKFLDMLIDDTEEKFIELVEGTRAQTAVIDDYVKRIATALDDDLNTQFYQPAFRHMREETYRCNGVGFGQIEHTNVLTNNRMFAKVQPQATMEFDLPRRRIMVAEAMQAAQAAYNDYGALMNDPGFLALTKLNSGQSTAATHDSGNGSLVRDVLPGLPSQTGESAVAQGRTFQPEFDSQLEALIPDPAIYKFETGTGYEIRPVIQPDGQSVVFDFNYMYTTNIREPVRADEKHLGRVKRHFVDTDVQIGNYELREVSRYRVALKASRTSNGVPLLEDLPIAGALFRPQPSEESSLQQNVILAKSVIFPTLYDLMGLRWAPAVADLDVHDLQQQEFIYRNRMKWIRNEVYDYSSTQVDEFLRVPTSERRADLYRSQKPIPRVHKDGSTPLGNNRFDSELQEGYGPEVMPAIPVPINGDAAPLFMEQSKTDSAPESSGSVATLRKLRTAPKTEQPSDNDEIVFNWVPLEEHPRKPAMKASSLRNAPEQPMKVKQAQKSNSKIRRMSYSIAEHNATNTAVSEESKSASRPIKNRVRQTSFEDFERSLTNSDLFQAKTTPTAAPKSVTKTFAGKTKSDSEKMVSAGKPANTEAAQSSKKKRLPRVESKATGVSDSQTKSRRKWSWGSMWRSGKN